MNRREAGFNWGRAGEQQLPAISRSEEAKHFISQDNPPLSNAKKAAILAQHVRQFAATELQRANKEQNLPNWLRAEHYSQGDSSMFEWIYNLGNVGGFDYSNYSFQDFFQNEYSSEKTISEYQTLARNCIAMLGTIRELEVDEIALALKRIREKDKNDRWHYLTVAKFGDNTESSGYVLYSPGGVQCAEHACDDLYKEMKRQGSAYYLLPYKSRAQHFRESMDEPTLVEYRDVAQDLGKIRGAEREVSRALVGYYTNLRPIRLPHFIVTI